ncbi:MAG: hypothetical protein U1E25_08220 [Methylocystis sp.]
MTEFASALSIKCAAVRSTLRSAPRRCRKAAPRLAADSFVIADRRQSFSNGGTLREYALGLRAGNALHLAVCAEYGATLCTLDRRLAGQRFLSASR